MLLNLVIVLIMLLFSGALRVGGFRFLTTGTACRFFSGSKFKKLSQRSEGMKSFMTIGSAGISGVEIESKVRRPKKFKDFPFVYHEELEVTIEDLTNLGMGVAKFPLKDGSRWTVMIPMVIPGEVVRCRVYNNHDNFSEADLISIIVPSPDRIEPPCPYFQNCGGCQYQHISVPSQHKWKKKQIENGLRRIGGFDATSFQVSEVVGSDNLYGYRSKLTPHFSPAKTSAELKIGFQMRGTRTIVDIDECMIASPGINARFKVVRKEIADSLPSKVYKKDVTLLFRQSSDGFVTTDFNEDITETVNGLKFQFRAGEFFQNNPFVLPMMIDHVISEAKGSGDCINLVDTYCGSGVFALSGANSFKNVFGVEVSALAINAARNNAALNNVTNAQFLCGSSEAIFSTIQHLNPAETVLVIDPPRKGCDTSFLEQLFAFKPRRLVYVSCDPSTQARDAKEIVSAGYRMENITPFDLFPQTRHIENVITFSLIK